MADPRMFGAAKSTETADAYKIEKNTDDIFVTYSSHPHRVAVRERVEASQAKPMPEEEILDCFQMKIHISINKNDVAKVYLDLIQLLLNAIAEEIIKEFKHIRFDAVETEYKAMDTELKKTDVFKNYLSSDGTINIPDTEENLKKEWEEFLIKHDDGVTYQTEKTFLLATQERLETATIMLARLMEGSQFTVYLPLKHDLAGIARLQNNISKLLTDKKINAGNVTPAQSPIDKFVLLRLETLDGEYVSATTADEKILAKVQQHQNTSALFKYLQTHKNDNVVALKKIDLDIRESENALSDPFRTPDALDSINPNTR